MPIEILMVPLAGMVMVVLLVAMGTRAKTKQLQLKQRLGSGELERRIERLEESLELGARIEERLANLETIVLDQEKVRRFREGERTREPWGGETGRIANHPAMARYLPSPV